MLKKTSVIFLLLLYMFIISGCESINQPVSNDSKKEELDEVNQLKAEIELLKSKLERGEMEADDILLHDREAFLQLERFRSMGAEPLWNEVTIFNEEHRVTIADQGFLESLQPLLVIDGQISWSGAIPYTLEPFSIELKNKNETVLMHAVAREAVEFPEILPGIYFRVEPGLTNLGRALLPKPDFLPVGSLESRLLDSGFLLILYDDTRYYDFSESRIRSVAVAFLRSDKKEWDKPNIENHGLLSEVSFFLYGDEIVMDIYREWIRIKDDEMETWYRVSPFDAGQIDISLRAD